MNSKRYSAVFDTPEQAKVAVDRLVDLGVPRTSIHYAGRDGEAEDGTTIIPNADDNVDAPDVVRSVALGGGAGALLAVGALAIPFFGPAVAAGALAASVPGVALTGALMGGAINGIRAGLIDHGFDEDDAEYFSEHLDKGGILITVDGDDIGYTGDVDSILAEAGGHRRGAAIQGMDNDSHITA